jgi:XapX domain-containing protein
MTATILSLIVGVAVGAIFSFFKLPIPAPITFSGVVGIVGVWLGFSIITKLFGP